MSGDNDTRMKTWVQKWLKEFCGDAHILKTTKTP